MRMSGLGAQPLVVGSVAHRALIAEQLAEIAVEAQVLLEPSARDSAAAMAAAALWVFDRDPQGIMAVVSADHHIPDVEAFQSAVRLAAGHAARGWIVTLGVKPTEPSTAYGYIRPVAGEGVRAVAAFVEKPGLEAAKGHMAAGDLWNSGNFIAPAGLLAEEMQVFAPLVLMAAREGLAEASGSVLGPGFEAAPKISIDYAVMERTSRAAVAPVNFAWSDVGAWDAVLAASTRDEHGNRVEGDGVVSGADNTYVRAGGGLRVTALGVSNLAIIAEGREVLVCDLQHSQQVKGLVDGLGVPRRFENLTDASIWFDRWLKTAALPVWSALGVDHSRGGYFEAIGQDGVPRPAPRRGRVQGRQIYAFAQAGHLGWQGPWRQAAWQGLEFVKQHFVRPDGLFRTLVAWDGAPLDETAAVYDQAFALLGLASLHAVDPAGRDPALMAAAIRQGLEALRHPTGGFREAGDQPFQANAHMHLFEGALAWAETGDASWNLMADEIAAFALKALIDSEGVLHEFFEADWSLKVGDDGRLVEPGHQFEWAWLMERWGRIRSRPEGRAAALRLYAAGRKGVDPKRGCAVNALWEDLTLRDGAARLWPQTEHLKAALVLGSPGEALQAANCLKLYLETGISGLWRDKLRVDGTFVDEAAPATSLYHIICSSRALFEAYPPVGR